MTSAISDTWFYCGVVVLIITCLITLLLIHSHYLHYKYRILQSLFVNIVLIGPLFCGLSVIRLKYPHNYIPEAIMASYEALATFFLWCCMILYAGGTQQAISIISTTDVKFRIFGNHKTPEKHYHFMKYAVLQWTITKPLAILVVYLLDKHDEGRAIGIAFKIVPIAFVVRGFLGSFRILKEELKGKGFEMKFFIVKAFVGLTVIQGMIENSLDNTDENARIMATLIIIESCLFSIFSWKVFNGKECTTDIEQSYSVKSLMTTSYTHIFKDYEEKLDFHMKSTEDLSLPQIPYETAESVELKI